MSIAHEIAIIPRLKKAYAICQPPTFAQIEQRRRTAGLSLRRLLMVAGVGWPAWYDGKAGRCATRASTLLRLALALDDLTHERPAARPPAAIAGLIRLTELMLADQLSGDARLIVLVGRRARALAIYLVAVELEIENAEIARALGCKRQNVHQLRLDVEELRDKPAIDALLDHCATLIKGTTP